MTAERLYALLLRLYPAAFRREYGQMMLEAFQALDREYRHRRFRFSVLVLADVTRSLWQARTEHWAGLVAHWPVACGVGALAGSLSFFGILCLADATEQFPSFARLLIKGSVTGLALGWAQCATVGASSVGRRLWLSASLAAGILAYVMTTILSGAASAIRRVPEYLALSVAAAVGVALLVLVLILLFTRGQRDVARSWIRMNAMALPAVVIAVMGLFALLEGLANRGWLIPMKLFWYGANPVVIATIVGSGCARTLKPLVPPTRTLQSAAARVV